MQGGRNLIKRLVARFARPVTDDRGAVLVYVSLGLTVFMGMAALAIDASRVFTLQTEMQSAADAFALAAAAELDGNAGAQARAQAAIDNMLQNKQTFATGANAIAPGDLSVTFYSSIPSDDQALPSTGTTDDTLTHFVRVKVNQRQTANIFAEFIGGGSTATATAQAVAGFTQAVCKFTPLFICNPYEGTGTSFLDAVNDSAERRRLIDLKKGPGGGNGSFFPGNFGFLQPQSGQGANQLKQSLGKVDPGTCFEQTGVDLQTGSIASVRDAINTRFDLYEGNFNGSKNDPSYRPALDMIKGYIPGTGGNGACNPSLDTTETQALPLPIDNCFATATCGSLGGQANRWGDGDWNFDKYWDMNHGNRNLDFTDDSGKPNSWSNNNLPTRYDVYRWEVANNQIPDKHTVGGENGNPANAPRCYSGGSLSDEPDRRVIYAAVLNCSSLSIQGGSGGPFPAIAFVKMFMTQPMTKIPGAQDTDGDLFVELIDVVKPGVDDAVLHDMVQLYK